MKHEKDRIEGEGVDPSSDLALLRQMNQAVEAETWLPRSELWLAPLPALGIVGIVGMDAFRDGPTGAAVGSAMVGVMAFVVAAVSAVRRRRVRPAGPSIPRRTAVPLAFILLVSWLILRAWDLLTWSDDSRVLWLVGGWLATTLVLAASMAITNRWRRSLMGGSR